MGEIEAFSGRVRDLNKVHRCSLPQNSLIGYFLGDSYKLSKLPSSHIVDDQGI